MRLIGNSTEIAFGNPGAINDPAVSQTRFIEGADAEQLEREFQQALDEFLLLNQQDAGVSWALLYVDLAGGGDGHKFMCQLVFGDTLAAVTAEVSGGVVISAATPLKAQFYQAESLPELGIARQLAWTRLPAVQPLVPPNITYRLFQTLSAGASQGLRFMGVTITQQDQ